jgi:hypothetical protein
MFAGLLMIRTAIEWLFWAGICTGLALSVLVRIGEDMYRAISWIVRHAPRVRLSPPRIVTFLLAGALAAVTLATPAPTAAQGWWWGSPAGPGFDRNTVIQATGRATQVDIAPRGGPSTLRLETEGEVFTVMLAPGRYLLELHPDIQNGDPLVVEGSKMMDRRGNLHLVAARVTNRRNGIILELRDETGRPRWMGGRPQGNGR